MTDIAMIDPPAEAKSSYYSRREAQERALAARCADPAARYAHRELASRYAEIIRVSVV